MVGLGFAPDRARATDATLSDAGLLSLDWCRPSGHAYVEACRDILGPGVEFDIRFPSNKGADDTLYLASTSLGGEGLLVGLDLSDYDNFALTVTLVAVDGQTSPEVGGALVVGALVYDAKGYHYRPEVVDMGRFHGATATSVTYLNHTVRQKGLGIQIRMFQPHRWSPEGNTVTILIEPTTLKSENPVSVKRRRSVQTVRSSKTKAMAGDRSNDGEAGTSSGCPDRSAPADRQREEAGQTDQPRERESLQQRCPSQCPSRQLIN